MFRLKINLTSTIEICFWYIFYRCICRNYTNDNLFQTKCLYLYLYVPLYEFASGQKRNVYDFNETCIDYLI